MKKYLFYNSEGRITNWMSVPDTISATELMQEGDVGFISCSEYFDVDDRELFYVQEGELVEKPIRPDTFYQFSYTTKQWFDPRDLERAKADKWSGIKKERDKKYNEPFLFNGNLFQPDVQTIMAKVQVAQLDLVGFSQEWLTVDNSSVTLSGSDMVSMGMALDTQHSQIFAQSQQIRALIEAAITNEQVDAITWNSI